MRPVLFYKDTIEWSIDSFLFSKYSRPRGENIMRVILPLGLFELLPLTAIMGLPILPVKGERTDGIPDSSEKIARSLKQSIISGHHIGCIVGLLVRGGISHGQDVEQKHPLGSIRFRQAR